MKPEFQTVRIRIRGGNGYRRDAQEIDYAELERNQRREEDDPASAAADGRMSLRVQG